MSNFFTAIDSVRQCKASDLLAFKISPYYRLAKRKELDLTFKERKIIPRFVGKPKRLKQIVIKRKLLNSDNIHLHSKDGPKDKEWSVITEMYSYKYLIGK